MSVIEGLEGVINNEIGESINWYDEHSKRSRRIFRILGVLTIFISVVIPFLSQDFFEFELKKLYITALSLSITVVTGINTFFKPEHSWRLNMNSKLNLEALYTTWKLEMLEAKTNSEEDQTVKECFLASHKFIKAAQNVTASNTEGFFTNIKYPGK